MFSKGRKLVDLVKQNDKATRMNDQQHAGSSCRAVTGISSALNDVLSRKPAKKTACDKSPPDNASYNGICRILEENDVSTCLISESNEINEAIVLVDESLNSNISEQSKITSKHVIIPESPALDSIDLEDLMAQSAAPTSNVSVQRIETMSCLATNFDSNRLTPVHNASKYFADLDSGAIIEGISSFDQSHNMNSEILSSHSNAPNTVPDILSEIIASDASNRSFNDSLAHFDCSHDSSISTSPNNSNGFQPLSSTLHQSTSKVLRRDLCMSDDTDVVAPYVDSEFFRPVPSPPPLSPVDSESEKENNNDNLPKRRRKGQPEKWQRNVLKKLRQSGQKYVNRKGKCVEAKKCVPTDCSKCRFKCNENFPDRLRHDIFNEYWNLGDDKRQKMFISSLVKHCDVLRKFTKAKKNRTMSRAYFLVHKSVGQHRVCQKFFCNTFNISAAVINTCSRNSGKTDLYVGKDGRQGKVPFNKTPVEVENLVKEHIDMFPRVESHYCRKNSKKQYLESDLNMSRLYNMYKLEYCVKKEIHPVSSFVFQKIFHSYEPRLAFYKPKKDQCTKCNVYNRAENKVPLQDEYDAHKRREQDSLTMKAEDKGKCITSGGTFRAVTFDMQAILSVPFTGDSKIFYLRKLSLYNFTILDCHKNTGYCYLWDESNGKKGSVEIGTMLLKYFSSLPETVNHVASFSDTCGGQNRNKYVTLAALYAVNNIPHLNTIDLKFMESGHSYLEADSIHATIERARKHKNIFTIREYALIIQSARSKPKPYDVFIAKFDEFYDLKGLEKALNCNTTKNTAKENVQWLKIKWLQFKKESPTSIFYKYELRDPNFMEINLCKTRSTKKKEECIKILRTPLEKAYKSKMPISQAKKKDLLTLLKDGIIPSEYTDVYNAIPTVATITHNLTDSEESDDE